MIHTPDIKIKNVFVFLNVPDPQNYILIFAREPILNYTGDVETF